MMSMKKVIDLEIEAAQKLIEYRLELSFPNGVPEGHKWPVKIGTHGHDYAKFNLDRETFGSILFVLRERGIIGQGSRECEQDDFIDDHGYLHDDYVLPDFFVLIDKMSVPEAGKKKGGIVVPKSTGIVCQLSGERREVTISGHYLCSPRFNGDNAYFLEYVLLHPNEKIAKEDIEAYMNKPLKKKLDDIVRELGFEKNVKKLFFPQVAGDAVIFRNPIYQEHLEQIGIGKIDLAEYAKEITGKRRKSEKRRGSGK